MSLSGIDVAILAGGLGTRLRDAVADLPKVLAPVRGRAFLDHLLDWLAPRHPRSVVLCLGYRHDLVEAHLGAHPRPDLTIKTSVEPEPLGTKGGLALARPHLTSDPVVVLNGDSWADVRLGPVVDLHRATRSFLSIVAAEVEDAGRYGRLVIGEGARILRFEEKRPDAGPGPINAGIYVFSQAALSNLDTYPGSSLERDLFAVLAPGSILAVPSTGRFIDIGTPASLQEAASVLP